MLVVVPAEWDSVEGLSNTFGGVHLEWTSSARSFAKEIKKYSILIVESSLPVDDRKEGDTSRVPSAFKRVAQV